MMLRFDDKKSAAVCMVPRFDDQKVRRMYGAAF